MEGENEEMEEEAEEEEGEEDNQEVEEEEEKVETGSRCLHLRADGRDILLVR